MSQIEKRIVQLAEKHKEPDAFITRLERLSGVSPIEKGNFFLEVGRILHRFSYFALALNSWNHALKYLIENGDEVGIEETILQLAESCKKPDKFIDILERSQIPSNEKGDFFFQVAAILHELSYFLLALSSLNHALGYLNKDNDKIGVSECYIHLGITHCALGDFGKAIEYYNKSLRIKLAIGDSVGESKCYTNLGNASFNLGDFRKAIEYHEKSLKIDKEIGDRFGEAAGYIGLGSAYHDLGDFGKAIEYYERSLEIARETGDRRGEAAGYIDLAIALRSLGDSGKAIEYYEKALEIAKEIGDKSEEAASYMNLGNAYRSLGDFGKAIEYHEKSLEIAKRIGHRSGEAKCYTCLGAVYDRLGFSRKAMEYHKKALEIKLGIGDRSGESTCYLNFGNAYHNLGDFGKAIEYYERSLEIAREIGDRLGELKCYMGLGAAYQSLGDFGKAIEYHEKSLEIAKRISHRSGEAKCYTNIGVAHRSSGDFGKAVDCYERSLEIAREIRDRAGEAAGYTNLGAACLSSGDSTKGIEYHEKSLRIHKEIGDRSGEAICYANLGFAFRRSGDSRKAIQCCKKSLKIFREAGNMDSERVVNLNLGLTYHESKPEVAFGYFKRSIELSEMISGRLVEEEHKISFYTRISDAYRFMIPLCLKMQKRKEAFEYTERSKSRAFLHLLAATEIRPTVELTRKLKSLIREEEESLVRLREIQTRHLRRTKVSVKLGEIDRVREKLGKIYDRLKQIDPEYAFARRGTPLSFKQIKHLLHSQRRPIVLAEYFITKSKTFLFVMSSKDRQLHVETVPASVEKLNLCLENYRREVVYHSCLGDVGCTWLDLGDCFIKPVSSYLTEGDVIYFVPHGLLHYLPLHALQLEGEPLIKKHPVAYSPSASLIRFCQNKGSGKMESCASFGVMFEEEAENVAELFNTESFNGRMASKDRVLEKCIDRDIIHFSCHGYFDNLDPLSSGIVLYKDEILTAREIFDMRLNAELVALSACETGLNERRPGDELIGLTRAFIYAGAPSVVVSLWSVDARSTQELMLEFYKRLKSGVDKATALQGAQKKIMEKEEWSHPYYWAPFILIGDWQ